MIPEPIYEINHNQITLKTIKGCELCIAPQGTGTIAIPISTIDIFQKRQNKTTILKVCNLFYANINMVTTQERHIIITFTINCYIGEDSK